MLPFTLQGQQCEMLQMTPAVELETNIFAAVVLSSFLDLPVSTLKGAWQSKGAQIAQNFPKTLTERTFQKWSWITGESTSRFTLP